MFNSAEHCRSVARIRRGSVNAGRLSVDWPGRGSKRREKRTAGNGLKIENAAIIYFANIQVRLPRRPAPRLEHFDARSPSVSLFFFSPSPGPLPPRLGRELSTKNASDRFDESSFAGESSARTDLDTLDTVAARMLRNH